MSNSFSIRLGSSGICSCSHDDGTISPKAATTLHANTVHGRVRSHVGDTTVQRAKRKMAMVTTLTAVVIVMSLAVVTSLVPLTSRQMVSTINPPISWRAKNSTR